MNYGFPISIFFFSLFCSFKSWAQYGSDNIDVAQQGDGIYEFLSGNDLPPTIYKAPFIKLNAAKLKGDTILIPGTVYLLPEIIKTPVAPPTDTSRPTSITDHLYGGKYSKVPIIDNKLKGAVYYLVSGHGGPDPGALGTYGPHTLSEDEYAYDVTLRLARNLTSHGATVYMIIQDETNGIRDEAILKMDKTEKTMKGEPLPLNQKDRLKQRVDIVNELYYKHQGAFQRLIAIHIDSRSQGQNIDVFFIITKTVIEANTLLKRFTKFLTQNTKDTSHPDHTMVPYLHVEVCTL
jgi:N-acetylmuramoyl-L-alanine amidase